MGQHNQRLGAWGEDVAARWYQRRGYAVVERNWRTSAGELDLIVVRDRQLVFSEVKTRSSLRFGAPIEAITVAKQRRLRRLGAAWIRERDVRPRSTRYDVVSIVGGTVEVFEGVL